MTDFLEASLYQSDESDGFLPGYWYKAIGTDYPNSNAATVAIILADNYETGGLISLKQIASLFAKQGYHIKRISNAIQLQGSDALILPPARLKFPAHFFSPYNKEQKTETEIETQCFARCIVSAVNQGIPLLTIGNSTLLLAAMGGLKLTNSERVETSIDHTKKRDIAVEKDSPFCGLDGLKVAGASKVLIASPETQCAEAKTEENNSLPFWAYTRDGTPVALADLEHGIIGIHWVPDFSTQENQIQLLKWLHSKVEENRKARI